jgi:hypothetical protein
MDRGIMEVGGGCATNRGVGEGGACRYSVAIKTLDRSGLARPMIFTGVWREGEDIRAEAKCGYYL